MATAANRYQPDYAVPPGWVLAERLEAQGISHAEFARRCGRSPKLISEIIAGKAPVEPVTALQFERVLGVDARIWIGIESDYRLHQAREAEKKKSAESAAWAKRFPVSELVKRRIIPRPASSADKVSTLLAFFGVASVEAWQSRHDRERVAYRHSPSFRSDERVLTTWLRLGELEAEQAECADYSEPAFKRALVHIRELTAIPIDEALPETRRLCLEAGVVLTITKPLPGMALSGTTRWLTPRKALTQLSARHLTCDHLWFSFFHEAAHILFHSKKGIFVQGGKGKLTDADAEADEWASDFLLPRRHWDRFIRESSFDESDVVQFAASQRIDPSIVVGRLQHEGQLPWNQLNHLKSRLQWGEDAGCAG